MLNKRLAKILEPLQFLYISTRGRWSKLDEHYQSLTNLEEELQQSIRYAHITLSPPVGDVLASCVALQHLTGLRTLELDVRIYDTIDDEVLAAISSLPKLSRLDF